MGKKGGAPGKAPGTAAEKGGFPIPSWLIVEAEHLVLQVLVQPKSSRNRIAGVHGDAVKVCVAAKPVDGAANAACVKFLAKSLKIPPSDVDITSGHTGRRKQIRIDLPAEGSPERLERIQVLLNLVTAEPEK